MVYKTYDELPLFIDAKTVSSVLGISRTSAYELMHQKTFPTLKIGARMVVPKEKFIKWVNEMSASDFVKTLCEFFVFKSPPRVGNFFPLPNEIFNMDLCAGEIALYSYLMRMEDRETYSCYPSFKTIGNALRMSRNTVMKYVHSLEEKGLITTEHTSVITQEEIKRNGNLKYQILPIKCAVDEFHQKQIDNGGIKQKN